MHPVFLFACILALPSVVAATPQAERLDPNEMNRLAARPSSLDRRLMQSRPSILPGQTDRHEGLRDEISPERFATSGLSVRPLEGLLDYDEENQVLYGPGRTQVLYGDYFLESDRLVLDNRIQEVHAEGNVIFRVRNENGEPDDEMLADSFRFNFAEEEGVAFGATGSSNPIYFRTVPPKDGEDASLPQLRQLSRNESLFRNTEISACDFVIPHYNIRAREIILYPGDRVFLRRATFRVMGAPVLYLPFYTRSLDEGSPWFIQLGGGGRTGARMRVGYQYEHQVKEPTFEDDDEYEVRSKGQAQVFADVLSKRGLGGGMQYQYLFAYGRHRGELHAYALHDTDRKVGGNNLDPNQSERSETQRWELLWRNRSEITEDVTLLIDIDAFSDPEVFYDILDAFADDGEERERQVVRRGRGAVTYLQEAYVARLMVEVKDRAGVDRFQDFSNPSDNNRDLDFDTVRNLRNADSDGIAQDRWGRVTKRMPQMTFATRYLPLGDRPLYLIKEINIYNNLDKGLNAVDSDDDGWVRGIDIYDQLLWQYKITERYILIAKIGAGVGVAHRDDKDLSIEYENRPPGPGGMGFRVDRLIFTDDDGTFLIGTEEFNHDDIEDFYAWVDASIRLNARFSDALTGYILWKYRLTTDDFIGDFYAQIGDTTSREDLFNYRLREHWIEGNLTYQLLAPILRVYARAGLNLTSDSDLYPNEDHYRASTGFEWSNQRGTWQIAGSVGTSSRRLYHESDPRSGEQKTVFARGSTTYRPVHGRWFGRAQVSTRTVSDTRAEPNNSSKNTNFSDEDDRTRVTLVYGRELGAKWDAEAEVHFDSRVSGVREAALTLQRDMHDALLIIRASRKRSVQDADDREDNPAEFDLVFGLEVKLPGQEVAFGPGPVTVLDRQSRQPVVAY